jgi:hypothetical protein
MNRRRFGIASLIGALPAFGQQARIPDRGPQLPGTLVQEFVRAAHGDLAKTKSMLGDQPALLNACWDWGGGDFETGLGGASHMGSREVAEYLIAQGARMDIFAAAMLGRLEIVEAMVRAFPGIESSKGPHGIPLIAHAKKGGAEAEPVVRFLTDRKAGQG